MPTDGSRELLVKLRDVLAPLDAKIDFSLYVGTVEQMRVDLAYLRELLGEAHKAIVEVLDAGADSSGIERKLSCGCYAYGNNGVWSISAVAFLCDKGHKQGDTTCR